MTIKRVIRPIAILFVSVVAVAVVFHVLSAPSHGHTTSTGGKIAAQHVNRPIAVAPATTSESPYYTLQLPAGYVSQSTSQSTPGLLYQQTIIKAGAGGSQIISVAVQHLGTGGLSDLSAYQLRTTQSARYVMSTIQVGGSAIPVARDTQSAAVVAFWEHGSVVATIGVTTGLAGTADEGNRDELRALQPLLDGWRWR